MPITSKTKSVFGHWPFKVFDITDTALTVTPDHFGSVIFNSADVLAATLPTPIPAFNGAWVKFLNVDDTITIDCATADLLVVFNDATADSIETTTASHIVGNAYTALCTGAKWLIRCHPADEGVTQTIVTA
jgi:hypothetical protein